MWPRCLPHIESAIRRSTGWTLDKVQQELRTREALLWVVIDGPVVIGSFLTEVYGKTAYVALLGGSRFREWRSDVTKVERWARDAGCTSIEFDGRAGWVRLMSQDGFRNSKRGRRKMTKELQHG
jgi:hypothetical protein